MKVGVYSPYLDTLGGGERYALTFAEMMMDEGHEVEVFWEEDLTGLVYERLSIDLKRVNFVRDIFGENSGLFHRAKVLSNYDLLFYLSDGSIPLLTSRENVLHFQVPFHGVGGANWKNWLKLKRFKYIVCNSLFTKRFIDKEYEVDSRVIYPPVDTGALNLREKENIILSVGRFNKGLHAKRQEVLIAVFKKMADEGLRNWRLVLGGGVTDKADGKFVNELKKTAEGYAIKFLVNEPFATLREYYSKAKIYWHAAGFGVDQEKNPELVEHFGISIVEAMAAGCVPMVVGKGGPKEIVSHEKNGFFWQKQVELESLTRTLVIGEKLRRGMAKKAMVRSRDFSKKVFRTEFLKTLGLA